MSKNGTQVGNGMLENKDASSTEVSSSGGRRKKTSKKRGSIGDTATHLERVQQEMDGALDDTGRNNAIYGFYDNIEIMELAMKELLGKKLAQECATVQTESTSITAQDVEVQTLDEETLALGSSGNDHEKFVLPDLDECIANLRIDVETQTDMRMRDLGSDGRFFDRDNVVVIYRNPRMMTTFLLPYVASALGISLFGYACYRGFRWVSYVRALESSTLAVVTKLTELPPAPS